MNIELKGIVKAVNLNTGNEKFQKSELVLTTDLETQYPQAILIEFGGNKSNLIDTIGIGQDVTVKANLNGREWTNPEGVTKYFNSVQGWKIDVNSGAPVQQGAADLPF